MSLVGGLVTWVGVVSLFLPWLEVGQGVRVGSYRGNLGLWITCRSNVAISDS